MADSTRQTVFIVDDDPAIRESVTNLLDAVGIVARPFSSAEEFKQNWRRGDAGCLLLDARLPGISGMEFQEQMRAASINLPIIFMTAHGDIPMVRTVMKAGAVEFLVKPFQKGELLHAVKEALSLDRRQRERDDNRRIIGARVASLSPRERAVMSMVIAGLLNKQIATELNLSEVMVKTHRRNMMDKMQAKSLAELVQLCERVQEPSWKPQKG